jgi:dipeptidyl-peptidase-3
MALYHSCDGQWEQLATSPQVDMTEVEKFLNYAAVFLSNIGNYFVSTYTLMSYALCNLTLL